MDYTAIQDNTRSMEVESKISTVFTESTQNNTIPCPNDESFLANKWIRFYSNGTTIGSSNITMQLTDGCSSSNVKGIDLGETTFCGALYRGWIRDGHPTENEGIIKNIVDRTFCYINR